MTVTALRANDDGKKIRVVTGKNRFSSNGTLESNAGIRVATYIRKGCGLKKIPILQMTNSPLNGIQADQFAAQFKPAGVTYIHEVIEDFIVSMTFEEDEENWAGVRFS